MQLLTVSDKLGRRRHQQHKQTNNSFFVKCLLVISNLNDNWIDFSLNHGPANLFCILHQFNLAIYQSAQRSSLILRHFTVPFIAFTKIVFALFYSVSTLVHFAQSHYHCRPFFSLLYTVLVRFCSACCTISLRSTGTFLALRDHCNISPGYWCDSSRVI